MKIIIAGGGIIGKNLTQELSLKHDVIVIDNDLKNCEEIYAAYSATAIHGDAKEIKLLKAAGIEKADYVLAVTDSDADNLIVTLLAKGFNVPNIFVRYFDPDYEDAFKMAGAHNLASTVSMVVTKFVLDIERPEIRRVASFGDGKAEISIIILPEDSIHIGKNIATIGKDIRFPEECIIAGIFDSEREELIVPRGHCTIAGGNQLFLVGERSVIERAYDYFSQKKSSK